MPIRTVCVDCRSKLRIPDDMAGQWVQCPKCNQLVHVPKKSEAPVEDKKAAGPRPARVSQVAENAGSWAASARQALSTSTGLGMTSLGLGLASVPFLLCVGLVSNFVGFYGDLVLCGVGLLMGLIGLFKARGRGERLLGYPLAGSATCLVALMLALLGQFLGGGGTQ